MYIHTIWPPCQEACSAAASPCAAVCALSRARAPSEAFAWVGRTLSKYRVYVMHTCCAARTRVRRRVRGHAAHVCTFVAMRCYRCHQTYTERQKPLACCTFLLPPHPNRITRFRSRGAQPPETSAREGSETTHGGQQDPTQPPGISYHIISYHITF